MRNAVERIQLGRSGLLVSRVVHGAMETGDDSQSDAERIDIIRAAIDAGSTSIDTAPLYGLGRSERLVGQAIRGRRAEVQILTKVGCRWDDPAGHGQVLFQVRDEHGRTLLMRRNCRPESVRLEVERSLTRLGVDVLDLVQVHRPDPDTPIPDTMGALADLLHEGKLHAIGVSNFDHRQVKRAQEALGAIPLACDQVSYNVIDRWIERDLLPLVRAERIGVLTHTSLAGGALSGKFRPEALSSADPRRNHVHAHPRNLRRIATALDRGLRPVAERHAVSVAQAALAWLLAQPGLSAVIVGASSPEQARASAAAADIRLSAEEERSIRAAFDALELDELAGKSPLERARHGVRRIVNGVRRRLPSRGA